MSSKSKFVTLTRRQSRSAKYAAESLALARVTRAGRIVKAIEAHEDMQERVTVETLRGRI